MDLSEQVFNDSIITSKILVWLHYINDPCYYYLRRLNRCFYSAYKYCFITATYSDIIFIFKKTIKKHPRLCDHYAFREDIYIEYEFLSAKHGFLHYVRPKKVFKESIYFGYNYDKRRLKEFIKNSDITKITSFIVSNCINNYSNKGFRIAFKEFIKRISEFTYALSELEYIVSWAIKNNRYKIFKIINNMFGIDFNINTMSIYMHADNDEKHQKNLLKFLRYKNLLTCSENATKYYSTEFSMYDKPDKLPINFVKILMSYGVYIEYKYVHGGNCESVTRFYNKYNIFLVLYLIGFIKFSNIHALINGLKLLNTNEYNGLIQFITDVRDNKI
jgi:hypothetical protein